MNEVEYISRFRIVVNADGSETLQERCQVVTKKNGRMIDVREEWRSIEKVFWFEAEEHEKERVGA
jgi:hypothetical protein